MKEGCGLQNLNSHASTACLIASKVARDLIHDIAIELYQCPMMQTPDVQHHTIQLASIIQIYVTFNNGIPQNSQISQRTLITTAKSNGQ
ncbi:hypothetical protein VNO80_14733 [Phaseolus coccineus]|uniref:Uncharacterized protein n=1 Tax=Phaseolus coccineus TaxID=3886 RepID=A0AAN9MNY0_PHACN